MMTLNKYHVPTVGVIELLIGEWLDQQDEEVLVELLTASSEFKVLPEIKEEDALRSILVRLARAKVHSGPLGTMDELL